MENPTTRRIAALVAALVGGFLLYYAANPESAPGTAFISFVLGLLLWIAIAYVLQRFYQAGHDEVSPDEVGVSEWKFVRFLRRAKEAAPLYLGMRLFLGYSWISAGLHKLEDPEWFQTGAALQAFWQRAVTIPEPPARPSITYPAYRAFIQYMLDNEWYTWFNYLIIFGELLVGIALLVGGLTAIAAFFGLLMNFAFVYAGTASSNPTLIILGVLIIIGWRVAGWWGLDRILLPRLGTPWDRHLFRPVAHDTT